MLRVAPRTGGLNVVAMMQPRKMPRPQTMKRERPEFTHYYDEYGYHRANSRAVLKEGNWGVRAVTPGWIKGNAIEAVRKSLLSLMRKKSKRAKDPNNRVIVRVEVRWPITRRTEGTRKGGGRGGVHHWVAPVKVGEMLFEVVGFEDQPELQRMALVTAQCSIGVKLEQVVRKIPPSQLNLDHVAEEEQRDALDVALESAQEEIKRAKIKNYKRQFRL